MTREIRIYVEGGGDAKEGKLAVRNGFNDYFRALRQLARQKKIRWRVIACGSRGEAFRGFRIALRDQPDAHNVLLVDSEAPVVAQDPWQHLAARDGWEITGLLNRPCYMMVQALEAWIIADRETLQSYYGQGFKLNAIPKHHNVEHIERDSLEPALKAATRLTSKGEYHKIRHGPKLLALLSSEEVCRKAKHCRRLFEDLNSVLESS
ncbi:MAG: DUF4276 family protein [Deltaproteobacteria bacterium]|nr:DUF4276 family protein [Deltaproteobacteria bacterium]